jgi:methionyl-tRNA synthetase
MKKNKRLITSALPYVNNTPHLGNLIQVLSADAFARYCRLAGYQTLYICGTDEYGTATETKALKEGVSSRALCDHYYALHYDIYHWFHIQFDHFGRTSSPKHTEIVQSIFLSLEQAGMINEKEISQLYCDHCQRFLADRFIWGTCPHCHYAQAKGDQCDACGKLLDPTDLIEPHCEVCSHTPAPKLTKHLYLDLPRLAPVFDAWVKQASTDGFWQANAIAITKSWLRDGLKERCITRDLHWGVPVPKAGYENKVFYVWFDAPIGYISITAEQYPDWASWWQQPNDVDLFQFIGKDNIPFHTVMFPITLLGSKQPWTMLHHVSSSEYLNYENGKFSKSRGVGIFGNDCKDTGIVADIWRFYIYYNRPEKSDALFVWKEFAERVNSELIGNFANFINRTISFYVKFYGHNLAHISKDPEIWSHINPLRQAYMTALDQSEIKEALRLVLQISDVGNKLFQAKEPWHLVKTDLEQTRQFIGNLLYLARDLGLLIAPYLPSTASTIAQFFHQSVDWGYLAQWDNISMVQAPTVLFKKLEHDEVDALRQRFAGEQTMNDNIKPTAPEAGNDYDTFVHTVDLRVAKIVQVARHPEADKLYILQLQVGDTQRQIVSSIVPYYTEAELQDHHVIIVANLKPAKFRGTPSQGMLLAAGTGDECEVIFTTAPHGTRVLPQGSTDSAVAGLISIDKFDKFPLKSQEGIVYYQQQPLQLDGQHVRVQRYTNHDVH